MDRVAAEGRDQRGQLPSAVPARGKGPPVAWGSAWVTSGGRVLLAVRPAPGGQGVETPVRAPVLSPLPPPPPLPPGDDLGLDEAPSSAGEDVLPVLPPAILMRPMSALWMGPAVDASIPAVDDFLLSGAAKTFPTSPSYCR